MMGNEKVWQSMCMNAVPLSDISTIW